MRNESPGPRYHSGAGEATIIEPADNERDRLKGREAFVPHELPVEQIDLNELVSDIGETRSSFQQLNDHLDQLAHHEVVLQYLSVYEASHSSSIEGGEEDLRDYYRHRIAGRNEHVNQYLEAIQTGVNMLDSNGSIQLDGLKAIHQTLMEGTDDYLNDNHITSSPGEFRNGSMLVGDEQQLHLGDDGHYYIAPPKEDVPRLMNNWVDYFNRDPEESPLVDASVLHAQIELIHGFADGNGRLGRLMTGLYLYKEGLIDEPSFGWSRVLEAKQETYFDRLYKISHNNQWNEWVEFVLDSFQRTQRYSTDVVDKAVERINNDLKKIKDGLRHSEYNGPVYEHLLENPVTTPTHVSESVGCGIQTAKNTLERLQRIDVVYPAGTLDNDEVGRSPSTYEYTGFINIFDQPRLERGL